MHIAVVCVDVCVDKGCEMWVFEDVLGGVLEVEELGDFAAGVVVVFGVIVAGCPCCDAEVVDVGQDDKWGSCFWVRSFLSE